MVATEMPSRHKPGDGLNVKKSSSNFPANAPGKFKESIRMQQKHQKIKVRPPPGEVYVGNLDHRITTAEIHKLFGMFGTVTDASIRVASGSPTCEVTKPSKKNSAEIYSVVVFTSFLDAVRAVKHLNGFEFRGRSIVVTRNLSQLPERQALLAREIKRIEGQVPNQSVSCVVWGKATSLTATVANRLTSQPTPRDVITDCFEDGSSMRDVWMRAERIARQAKAAGEAELSRI